MPYFFVFRLVFFLLFFYYSSIFGANILEHFFKVFDLIRFVSIRFRVLFFAMQFFPGLIAFFFLAIFFSQFFFHFRENRVLTTRFFRVFLLMFFFLEIRRNIIKSEKKEKSENNIENCSVFVKKNMRSRTHRGIIWMLGALMSAVW